MQHTFMSLMSLCFFSNFWVHSDLVYRAVDLWFEDNVFNPEQDLRDKTMEGTFTPPSGSDMLALSSRYRATPIVIQARSHCLAMFARPSQPPFWCSSGPEPSQRLSIQKTPQWALYHAIVSARVFGPFINTAEDKHGGKHLGVNGRWSVSDPSQGDGGNGSQWEIN